MKELVLTQICSAISLSLLGLKRPGQGLGAAWAQSHMAPCAPGAVTQVKGIADASLEKTTGVIANHRNATQRILFLSDF